MMMCVGRVSLAQNAGITGTVVDRSSGQPVIGATVMVENQEGSAVTNLDGRFQINNVNVDVDGNATVTVVSLGYKRLSQVVAAIDGQTTDVGMLRLRPSRGGRSQSMLGVFAGGNYSLLSGGNKNEYGLKLSSGFGAQFGVAYNFHFGYGRSGDSRLLCWLALQAEASVATQSVALSVGGHSNRFYAAFGGFVQVYPTRNFYIEAGAEYDRFFVLWDVHKRYIAIPEGNNGYIAEPTHHFEFRVGSMVNPVVGFGFRLDNGFGFNARYVMNVKSATETDNYVDKISSLQVSLSYMFNL